MFGIDDAIEEALIRVARQVLDSVLSQLNQQLNVVMEQAMQPMQGMLEQVNNGGVWKGKGADAFATVVSSVLPNVGQVAGHISTTSSNIQFARDIIDQADEEVDRLIQSSITGQFKFM